MVGGINDKVLFNQDHNNFISIFDILKFEERKKAKVSPKSKQRIEKQKENNQSSTVEHAPKRRRGRPRKDPFPDNIIKADINSNRPMYGPGRPRQHPTLENASEETSKNTTEKSQKALVGDQTSLFNFFASSNNKDSFA